MASVAARKDRLFAGGMLLLSLVLAIQSFRYPAESAQFPRFLSVLLILLSVLLVIRNVRAVRADTDQVRPDDVRAARPSQRPAGLGVFLAHAGVFVFGSTALYVLAIQWLGFLTGSVCFMVTCAFSLGNRRWALVLGWGLALPAFLYLLFHSVLGLQLPAGWFM
jgi:putative tricarboxylic transport membrane protein